MSNIDEQLMTASWRIQQKEARDEERERSAWEEAGRSVYEIAGAEHKRLAAAQQAVHLGLSLRRQIKSAKFNSFFFVLVLAVIKDFVDMVSLGTIGTLVNIFISITLYIVVHISWLQPMKRLKASVRNRILKYFWLKFIAVIVIEFIPFLNIFPFWTISVIFMKLNTDKEIRRMQGELQGVKTSMSTI